MLKCPRERGRRLVDVRGQRLLETEKHLADTLRSGLASVQQVVRSSPVLFLSSSPSSDPPYRVLLETFIFVHVSVSFLIIKDVILSLRIFVWFLQNECRKFWSHFWIFKKLKSNQLYCFQL